MGKKLKRGVKTGDEGRECEHMAGRLKSKTGRQKKHKYNAQEWENQTEKIQVLHLKKGVRHPREGRRRWLDAASGGQGFALHRKQSISNSQAACLTST